MSEAKNPADNTCLEPSMACGCCEGTEPITPQSTANRPGLSTLNYRIGTHGSFLETMKARLTSHCLGDPQACAKGEGTRPLAALSARDQTDPSIALLDAWATVGDVLTFYQERIANEGYLRTATERRSVLELANLVGYRPRPGVAASTYLTYTIDDNTKEEVLIPAGASVQSVLGPDELPQSFETREELKARAAWNRLSPRKTQPQQWNTIWDDRNIYLKGIATRLQPNDPLLIQQGGSTPMLCRVIEVEADTATDRTKVVFAPWDGSTEDNKVLKRIREEFNHLIKTAPEGKKADSVVEKLNKMSVIDKYGELIDSSAETLQVLRYLLEHVRVTSIRLKPWLKKTHETLTKVISEIGESEEAKQVLARRDSTFTDTLNALIKTPSQPLTNSLQLQRTLESSFRPKSDTGLKVTGLSSRDLKEALSSAIEHDTTSSPEPTIKVYALRLKAGVFGRNAPKRQVTVSNNSNSITLPIGEWPIMEVLERGSTESPTELPKTLFLDSNYDGILPGSWLVLDSSAVDVFDEELVMVEPAVFPKDHPADGTDFQKYLVVRAEQVAHKVTRAEYGISGESVRIELDKDWLRLMEKTQTELQPVKVASSLSNISIQIDPYQEYHDRDFQVIRRTAVYAQSEDLELAEAPIETPVCDGASEHAPLELDGLYPDLEPGRFVIVSGERSDIANTSGVTAAEAVMITEVTHDVRDTNLAIPANTSSPYSKESRERRVDDNRLPGDRIHTFLRFDKPLSYCYRRDSLKIYGNVVKATHGETLHETLGGGNGAKALQSFTLKQSPLTQLAAPTSVGSESSLQVFVNDVRWHETTSFIDISPTEQAFITRTDDSGKTTITFGNGREGARLPSGAENIKAIYRKGIGKAGNVRAEQLSMLSTRPLGVKEVINPMRATGGADRESHDQARSNTPLAVMSLDRLVSTQDYADFARGFAGIAKADAVELSNGRTGVVHVTIAGTDDIPIDTGSDLYLNLRRALIDLGDPFLPVQLTPRERLILILSADLRIDPDYRWEKVVTEVRAKLLQTFGFEQRKVAQDVTASEVLSILHTVRGVVYANLTNFGAVPSTIDDPAAESGRRPLTPDETAYAIQCISDREPVPRIQANPAERLQVGKILPAQLAILVPEIPETLILNQIKD